MHPAERPSAPVEPETVNLPRTGVSDTRVLPTLQSLVMGLLYQPVEAPVMYFTSHLYSQERRRSCETEGVYRHSLYKCIYRRNVL